ncbi:MAG: tyrosine--tRNA ligase, partial [bacterium]
GNPVLEYCRYILFEENESLTVTRLPKYGSNRTYKTYKNLESDYVGGNLHPTDLKKMVSAELEKLIRPVREYFETNEEAKKLYEEVKSYQITR